MPPARRAGADRVDQEFEGNVMSKDPLVRYEKKIKRPLSAAERSAIEAAPKGQAAGDPRKLKRQLSTTAIKARRQELGLKARAR